MRASTLATRTLIVAAALALVAAMGAANVQADQSTPPPIQGVTGTIATEETVKDVHRAGRGIFGKVARLFGLGSKDSAVSPDDAAAAEIFAGLTVGAAIVVQGTTTGETVAAGDRDRRQDEEAKETDGVITAVDRTDRTIAIRLADGTRRRLQFIGRADRAGAAVNRAGSESLTIVVKDAAGEPTVLLFERVR
jgi:hypothetical protein